MTPTEAAAAADFGRPVARKWGHMERWPYVPVLVLSVGTHEIQSQIKGLAFATKDEAVAAAEGHITRLRATLATQLAQPNMRALRRQYGVDTDDTQGVG